jgi:hypothetical protein
MAQQRRKLSGGDMKNWKKWETWKVGLASA